VKKEKLEAEPYIRLAMFRQCSSLAYGSYSWIWPSKVYTNHNPIRNPNV